jgi:hypothetical protein
MKTYADDSVEVEQAILSAMLLHGLAPKAAAVRWLLYPGWHWHASTGPADCFPLLWLGQVGDSPTVPADVRPAFAAAVSRNVKIASAVDRKTESARRMSLCCTLAALQASAVAMGVVDSLVVHFADDPADRKRLCEASTTVTGSDSLTADTAALWALEQPGLAGGGGGSNVPLARLSCYMFCCCRVQVPQSIGDPV